MAVVQPLRRRVADDSPRAGGTVVRIVDFLGPISPELVLVDEELARRARALLPEFPGIRVDASSRPRDETPRFAVSKLHDRTARVTRSRTVVVLAVAAAAAVVLGSAVAVLHPWPAGTPTAARPGHATVAPPVPPRTTPPAAPAGASAPAIAAPRFAWPAAAGAVRYRFALFLAGAPVYEQDLAATTLELPAAWTYRGRLHRLVRGEYRWVVWPLRGRNGARVGKPIVSARYVV